MVYYFYCSNNYSCSKKISGISKSIGKVIGEYEKTKEKIMSEKNAFVQQANSSYHVYKGPNIQRPIASEREKLEIIAKSLGMVDINDKADEELRRFISSKLNDSKINNN